VCEEIAMRIAAAGVEPRRAPQPAPGLAALYGEALREIARRTDGCDPGTSESAVHQVAVSALNGVPGDPEGGTP
jgi:hypothetical protein